MNTLFSDGPSSSLFTPLTIHGGHSFDALPNTVLTPHTLATAHHAPRGTVTSWGVPFQIDALHILTASTEITIPTQKQQCSFVLVTHTLEQPKLPHNNDGLLYPALGPSGLDLLIAEYTLIYEDGSEENREIHNRQHIGCLHPNLFEDALQAVSHAKDSSLDPIHVPEGTTIAALKRQGQTNNPHMTPWLNWVCALENPYPEKPLHSIRLTGRASTTLISGITLAQPQITSYPLRWQKRMKAVLTLANNEHWNSAAPDYDHIEFHKLVNIDLGQIICIKNLHQYPETWLSDTPETRHPYSNTQVLVEFTAHENAHFYIGSEQFALADVLDGKYHSRLRILPHAWKKVALRIIDEHTQALTTARVHIHGPNGEPLSPIDRQAQPSPLWFNDSGPESIESNGELSTYIAGTTQIWVPLGSIYMQTWKGMQHHAQRLSLHIQEDTTELTVVIRQTLDWRSKGWYNADTHTHFMSPSTALLQARCHDVDMVHVLAASWGELQTNTGDIDGRTHEITDGNTTTYRARVGIEARQRVLGHMSLCGFDLPAILPLGSGGPTSAPLGDAVEVNLCDWARQCRSQNGLAIMSHFGHPRAAGAVLIVNGLCDAVETELFEPFKHYALPDIYQYFNCGYNVPLVAGTDKMCCGGKVGWSRVYSKITHPDGCTLENWKESIRSGNTFVTQGPLLEFSVNDQPAGSVLQVQTGDILTIHWEARTTCGVLQSLRLLAGSPDCGASIAAETALPHHGASGTFSYTVQYSTWLAILTTGIRDANGHVDVTAHSSAVMLFVDGKPPFSATDAQTIRAQINGTYNYLHTIAIRPESERFASMVADTIAAREHIDKRLSNNA